MSLSSVTSDQIAPSRQRVAAAVRAGAQAGGASVDYLLATAQRESSLDPGARAKTSSAHGVFQFIESTWLSLIRQEGPGMGLAQEALAVRLDRRGRPRVDDPAAREALLALRADPVLSTRMAARLTARNREALAPALGREPTHGELYAAHVLGASGAIRVISARAAGSAEPPAAMLPEAARANRALFFERDGRARDAAGLMALFERGIVRSLAEVRRVEARPAPAARAFEFAGGAREGEALSGTVRDLWGLERGGRDAQGQAAGFSWLYGKAGSPAGMVRG
jgi:hypothetical protein